MIGKRILILVPHPDDEIVGCTAAIARALSAGRQVFTLYLTTGVAPVEMHWRWQRADHAARVRRRRDEALRVAARLGVKPVAFLAWSARTLRDHLGDARAHVAAALADPALAIDAVWVPAYEGGHQDHDVTNMLASTLERRSRAVQFLEFAEYNYRDSIVRSHEFVVPSRDDVVLVLTAQERQLKADLLDAYASERANLRHIEIGRERFRPLARYDYSRPPHASPLFYERFQWIPFRHPRVDFTSPTQVCEAMVQFRQAEPRMEAPGRHDARVRTIK
jgi:LmbE family N-acetylglucosaminyl deacetylase